jgi:hypothetical protein
MLSGEHLLAARGAKHYGLATMKTIIAILSACFVAAMITSASAAEKLQHVVCFKFKPTATPADIQKVERAFHFMKRTIPLIVSMESGTNVSKENKDKGFTHCFILTFKSEQDRDAYIVHPEHKNFGKMVGPMLDDVFVIDFVAKD